MSVTGVWVLVYPTRVKDTSFWTGKPRKHAWVCLDQDLNEIPILGDQIIFWHSTPMQISWKKEKYQSPLFLCLGRLSFPDRAGVNAWIKLMRRGDIGQAKKLGKPYID